MGRPSDPVVEPTELDKAYAAGLFDGEGCVLIARLRPQTSAMRPSFFLQSVVVNTNLPMLEWLKARWGGYIFSTGKKKEPTWRPSWQWRLGGTRQVGGFLNDIRLFTIDKRVLLDIAIEFADFQAAHNNRYGRRPMPDHVYRRQEELWRQHREIMSARGGPGRPPWKDRSWAQDPMLLM